MARQLTTRGIFLGLPEAEVENSQNDITQVFIDCTGIDEAVKNGKFLICGRKGSGKSAYAIYEKRRDNIADQRLTTIVHKEDFALEELINHEGADSNKRNVLFEWLILVKIVDLILESRIGEYLQEIRSLSEFKTKNAGLCKIDQYNIDYILNESEVNFAPLKSKFGLIRRLFAAKTIKAPFYKMVGPLRQVIMEVLKMPVFGKADFKIIFDDLDVRFKLSDSRDREMLSDLIRIAKRYNTEYINGTCAKIILMLRDDIIDKLPGEDGDLAKTISSATHKINWYTVDTYGDGRHSLLRNMINKRITAAMSRMGQNWSDVKDPWAKFVETTIADKPSFKYVLDYTFYLPRDLMAIFKDIATKNMKLPLSQTDIDLLITDYSHEKKREICDELAAHFPYSHINSIIELLAKVDAKYDTTYDDIREWFAQSELDISTLPTLIALNLIIPVDNKGKFYFNYRERIPTGHISSYKFTVPYILTRYFESR